MLNPKDALSVTQLNAYVKKVLWQDDLLKSVLVKGELANLHNYGGHLYFTLKDEKCSVRGVMWRSDAARLAFVPEDGMEVLVSGSVSVFERDGVYQLYATYMEPWGLGNLYAALEQLKAKLEKEGLFAPERKRPLPFFPRKVGVVTSLRGAAIKDIIAVGRRRYPGVEFVVCDARVQGDGAAESVVRGLKILAGVPGVDVIIIGRGGGSQEDLFVFNDERLARAIYACPVPVVSAVGHERDVTIADLVADVRAPTPSAAAEMVVPLAFEIGQAVERLVKRQENQLMLLLRYMREKVDELSRRPCLQKPNWFLLSAKDELVRLREDLEDSMKQRLKMEALGYSRLSQRLDALSPLKVLSRGFSVTRRLPDGEILRDYRQAPPGTKVAVKLNEGKLFCTVDESVPSEEELSNERAQEER